MTRTQEPMTPDYRQEWSWKTMNKMPDLAEQLAVEMTNATLPERIKIADRYLEQAELKGRAKERKIISQDLEEFSDFAFVNYRGHELEKELASLKGWS